MQRSSEKLANALSGIPGIPDEMIERAKAGAWGDYTSESATPQLDLINNLRAAMLSVPISSRRLVNAVIRDVIAGEFDGTTEEAREWANSPEGKMIKRMMGLE